MSEKVLLVDYENVAKLDLGAIPAGIKVPVFFGASQRTVTVDFLECAVKLGERFIRVNIEGQGKNALDFHIAFYLGEYLSKTPKAECIVLSRDKGFDPLVRHLGARGFAVRRAETLEEAYGVTRISTGLKAHIERVVRLLGKVDSNKRPRKRKTLLKQVASFCPKLPSMEVETIVACMESEGKISHDNHRLAYHF
jgi:hypothetical protein